MTHFQVPSALRSGFYSDSRAPQPEPSSLLDPEQLIHSYSFWSQVCMHRMKTTNNQNSKKKNLPNLILKLSPQSSYYYAGLAGRWHQSLHLVNCEMRLVNRDKLHTHKKANMQYKRGDPMSPVFPQKQDSVSQLSKWQKVTMQTHPTHSAISTLQMFPANIPLSACEQGKDPLPQKTLKNYMNMTKRYFITCSYIQAHV